MAKRSLAERKYLDLKYIKQLRLENHYSQAELARLLGLKSTDKYYRREQGDYKFKPEELSILSDLFNTPMEKFFTSTLR